MNPFKIKNNNIVVEIYVRMISETSYTYSWYNNSNERIHQSEEIQTSSRDVVTFIGLVECIKYLKRYKETKFIKCDSSKTKSWFLSGRIDDLNSYPDGVRIRLQNCLDWISNNQVIVKNVIPPWNNIVWRIPALTVTV